MEEITEADRIANDGPELLANGTRYKLHFGHGALRQIEKEFGSAIDLIQALIAPTGPRYYEAQQAALKHGLWKQKPSDATLDSILDSVDTDELDRVLLDNLAVALPRLVRGVIKTARAEAEKVTEQAEAGNLQEIIDTTASNGQSTTTSPSSFADLHPVSSGI